ncbi:MAG: hypothetical protein ACLGIN_15330, partial [Candidatus Sericytochromatia bacterium]
MASFEFRGARRSCAGYQKFDYTKSRRPRHGQKVTIGLVSGRAERLRSPKPRKDPLMTAPTDEVVIYSDGCSLENPGPGGWAAILTFKGREKEVVGG